MMKQTKTKSKRSFPPSGLPIIRFGALGLSLNLDTFFGLSGLGECPMSRGAMVPGPFLGWI